MSAERALSPDLHAAGLTTERLDPLRYDSLSADPYEVPGILRALMPSNVRVLDVGAGTGSVTLTANRDKHNDVLVIEPDEERAALCRARGLETRCGLLDDGTAAEIGKFDVVVFSDVLEHLVSPASMLATTRDILNPGGLVFASVPNVAHWTVRLRLLIGRFDYVPYGIMDATHLRWFTEKNLRSLFESAGFRVMRVQHSAGAWMPEYKQGLLRIVPRRVSGKAARVLTRIFPRLFGCQHVVTAKKV